MGNNHPKQSVAESHSSEDRNTRKQVKFQEFNSNPSGSLFGKSFISLGSQQSVRSVSRPWSRVSRRRWRESTLTLPYESSKTAWPVSQLESYFLPVFPINPTFDEKKFSVVDEVANGAFGKVFKVYDGERKKFYALKVLSKSKIIKENAVQQVKEEVQIQSACGHHSFIVDSPFHWQTRKKLYIVSEFVEGGELHKLLESYGVLPLELVKLYVAQIALILDFLHNAGVIYRDLKPENILLDDCGDVQIVDFGLSKWLSYGCKTKTLCGTLYYMAPEVVRLEPYGHACDWWSLGVIACRMLTGKFPASSVCSGNGEGKRKPGSLPEDVDVDVSSKDLLLRLLENDPLQRLRSLRTLQTIAFYKDYNFDNVKKKKLCPREILHQHFPHGPPVSETAASLVVEDFDAIVNLI